MNAREILQALRETLQDRSPGFQVDPVLSLAHGREDQFFLKGPKGEGILWGRVFYGSLCPAAVHELEGEIVHLFQTFSQKVVPYVFFPSVLEEAGGSLEKLPGRPNLYEYSVFPAEAEKGIALRPWCRRERAKTFAQDLGPQASGLRPGLKKVMRLTREELAELIDLGIDLRRMSRASSA